MPLEAIIAEVERCAGTQFDPQVAEAFVRVVAQRNNVPAGTLFRDKVWYVAPQE